MRTICSWTRQREKRPKLKILETLGCRAARAAGLPEETDLSLVFLPDRAMAELNESSLNHQGPTDVICFDLRASEPRMPKGEEFDADVEIYVCPDVARREAEKRALPYAREVVLYVVHGLLHAAAPAERALDPPDKAFAALLGFIAMGVKQDWATFFERVLDIDTFRL